MRSDPPPTGNNARGSTSRPPRPNSNFLGARGIPARAPTRSVTCFSPYTDPRVAGTSSNPFSIGMPHPNGMREAVPQAANSRSQNYPVGTSNITNGTRSPVNTVPVGGASIHLPPRPPSQQKGVAHAMTQPQQLLETGSHYQLRTDPSFCREQLGKYLRQLTERPNDNNINLWRQFVEEYYASGGKKRICLSACRDRLSTNLHQLLKDRFLCCHCGTYCQSGYEISFEELPIHFQQKFNSMNNEILELGSFLWKELDNKNIALYFPEVIMRPVVLDHVRIVRKGPLVVTFAPNKKIFSWEFCMRNYESLVSRTSLLPQINCMLRAAEDCSGASGSSSDQHYTQEQCNMIIRMGCNLAKKLEENPFLEVGLSAQEVQKYVYMNNNISNSTKNSMVFNSRYQQKIVSDSFQNYTGQATSGHYFRNKPIESSLSSQSQTTSSIISPSLRANNQQVNLHLPQLSSPSNMSDTSAFNNRHMVGTTTSSMTANYPKASPTFNATSLPDTSDPTMNPLKRARVPEETLGIDAYLGHRMTRQRTGDAVTGNGVHIGSESSNIASTSNPNVAPNANVASTSNPTPGLVQERNMCSTANAEEVSWVNPAEQQNDIFLDELDLSKFLPDFLGEQMNC